MSDNTCRMYVLHMAESNGNRDPMHIPVYNRVSMPGMRYYDYDFKDWKKGFCRSIQGKSVFVSYMAGTDYLAYP